MQSPCFSINFRNKENKKVFLRAHVCAPLNSALWMNCPLSLSQWCDHSLTGTNTAVHSCTQDASKRPVSTSVLVWCSVIYSPEDGVWCCVLARIQSANLKGTSRPDFKGDTRCSVWLFSATHPFKTHRVERNPDHEYAFNRLWAGSELRWNKCPHYLRENHSCPVLLSCVNWRQNAPHKPVQSNVTRTPRNLLSI